MQPVFDTCYGCPGRLIFGKAEYSSGNAAEGYRTYSRNTRCKIKTGAVAVGQVFSCQSVDLACTDYGPHSVQYVLRWKMITSGYFCPAGHFRFTLNIDDSCAVLTKSRSGFIMDYVINAFVERLEAAQQTAVCGIDNGAHFQTGYVPLP